MSEQYDNNNSGVLFKNDDKREGKKDPEYRGSAVVDHVNYWLSVWVNTSKDGRKYMSVKFKPKDEKATRDPGAAPAPAQAAADFDDSDIPF